MKIYLNKNNELQVYKYWERIENRLLTNSGPRDMEYYSIILLWVQINQMRESE